jgi:DNA primase
MDSRLRGNDIEMNGTAVEEIKAKLEIVPLISEYVQVKKAGASFMALCPFHGEKTPSMHVSPDKQMWYCHGCGEGGDIFGFVMRIEGVDFKGALELLARKAGVTLSAEDAKASSERQALVNANTMAAKYWHQVLLKAPQAAAARAYVEKRGLKAETLEDFLIGFAPDSWDTTLKVLKERGFTEAQLQKAGLVSKSEKTKGYFDRFRGRLMFPIRDAQGNVVGFTARIMPSTARVACCTDWIRPART